MADGRHTVTRCSQYRLELLKMFWPLSDFINSTWLCGGLHSSLRSKVTTFDKSLRGYSWLEAATVLPDGLNAGLNFLKCCGHPENS